MKGDILINALEEQNYLMHHGILGQKWGVRRYQNPDGSLTEAGRIRYLTKDGTLNSNGIQDRFVDIMQMTPNSVKYNKELTKTKDLVINQDSENNNRLATIHALNEGNSKARDKLGYEYGFDFDSTLDDALHEAKNIYSASDYKEIENLVNTIKSNEKYKSMYLNEVLSTITNEPSIYEWQIKYVIQEIAERFGKEFMNRNH